MDSTSQLLVTSSEVLFGAWTCYGGCEKKAATMRKKAATMSGEETKTRKRQQWAGTRNGSELNARRGGRRLGPRVR